MRTFYIFYTSGDDKRLFTCEAERIKDAFDRYQEHCQLYHSGEKTRIEIWFSLYSFLKAQEVVGFLSYLVGWKPLGW